MSEKKSRDKDRHKKSKKSKSNHKKHHTKRKHSRKDVNTELNESDYYKRTTEFRVWLKEYKNIYIEDLTTDEAQDLFNRKFIRKWNDGKLASMYYNGLPDSIIQTTARTKHQWGFVNNLKDSEKLSLATATDSVHFATQKAAKSPVDIPKSKSHGYNSTNTNSDASRDTKSHKRHRDSREHSRLQYTVDIIEDAGYKYSDLSEHEKKRAKRESKSHLIHGAGKLKDFQQDGLDLNEDFLMGESSYSEALREVQAHRDRRHAKELQKNQERLEKAAIAKAKEDATMNKFLHEMGIQTGNASTNKDGKTVFTIAPRT